MADYIDNQVKIFEKIEVLFDSSRNHLELIEKSLYKDIEEILILFGKEYKLITDVSTSVNISKYYHVRSRVKTLISLKEKLRRKNLGLIISSKHELTVENFDANHDVVRQSLYALDDVIGLRVVTELKADCHKVYKLIKDKNSYFKDRNIIFFKKELDNQPQAMKNGLPIYRIKGTYRTDYGFELQIKSKIDEAWGEMDHSIFYKDYSISPIKNSVQVTMNNVGELLDKIEQLLLGLRDSEYHYKEKKEEIEFLKELSENVSSEVKRKLGDNYEFGKIASTLRFLKNKTKVKNKDAKVNKLSYSFVDYKVLSDLCINYIKHRNVNFELLIMESLYFYWIRKSRGSGYRLNSRNYNKELELYLDVLIDSITINVNNAIDGLHPKISKNFIRSIIQKYSEEKTDRSIFLNISLVIKINTVARYFSDAYDEYYAEIQDGHELSDFKELIESIYIKTLLEYGQLKELDLVRNDYLRILKEDQLSSDIFELNKIIITRINNYKLQDDLKALKSVFFMEDILSNVLEKVRAYEKQ